MLAIVKRIERIRLYPTTRQAAALTVMLDVTRDLYNALLQQRRDAYRLRKITVTAKMQYAEITALRTEDAYEPSIASRKMPCCIVWTWR